MDKKYTRSLFHLRFLCLRCSDVWKHYLDNDIGWKSFLLKSFYTLRSNLFLETTKIKNSVVTITWSDGFYKYKYLLYWKILCFRKLNNESFLENSMGIRLSFFSKWCRVQKAMQEKKISQKKRKVVESFPELF